MIEIRDAVEADNSALLELQKKCPMGKSLILQFDSSPSYFNRSKHQTENHIIVAEENDNIVGSVSCAIMEKRVNEEIIKTSYNYGLMVDPEYRRKGIATLLDERAEEIATEHDADLIYCQIIQDNLPSMRVAGKRGFIHVKDIKSYVLMVYKPHIPSSNVVIRPAEESDLPRIVDLINTTYQEYDLYKPYTVNQFNELIEKRVHYELNNIHVCEKEGQIEACLGNWDYSKIIQMTVLQLARKDRITSLVLSFLGKFTKLPRIPEPGQKMTQYILQDIGFTKYEYLTELVKYINNIALDNDIRVLMTLGAEEPITDVLSKFTNTVSIEHIFVKPLKELDLTRLGQRKLFISME